METSNIIGSKFFCLDYTGFNYRGDKYLCLGRCTACTVQIHEIPAYVNAVKYLWREYLINCRAHSHRFVQVYRFRYRSRFFAPPIEIVCLFFSPHPPFFFKPQYY